MKTYSYWSSALAISSVARPVRLTFSGQRRPWAELRTTWSPSTSDQTSVEWIEPFSLSVETWQKLRRLDELAHRVGRGCCGAWRYCRDCALQHRSVAAAACTSGPVRWAICVERTM